MLKTGAIFFWTDMKRLFNWNMDNFKSNFLSRGQLGSNSNDKFFLSVLKMWQCCKYFFGNLIFALTARTLSGNRLNFQSHTDYLNVTFNICFVSIFPCFYFRAVINMTPFIPTFPIINPLERLQANPGIFQYQLYFHKEVSGFLRCPMNIK